MAYTVKENIVELPRDIVAASCGLALDVGGSTVKVAYVHKDDWQEHETGQNAKIPVRLATFSRQEIKDAFEYIKSRAHIKRDSAKNKPVVFTTGLGASQLINEIRQELDIETKNLSEMDMFVSAHNYFLKNQKYGELVIPIDDLAIAKIEAKTKSTIEIEAAMKEGTTFSMNETVSLELPYNRSMSKEDCFANDEDLFPSMLVMCGSAGLVIKVEKDGSFAILDAFARCGRSFAGLGSLLTGAKSFAELIHLAENGNLRATHQHWSDLTSGMSKENDDSIYAACKLESDSGLKDFPVFYYGNAVWKDCGDFSKEDLALSVFGYVAADIAQVAYLACLLHKPKHVFFCGNLVSNPLMQHYVSTEWGARDAERNVHTQEPMMNLHFLKNGAYYGALGAFLSYKEKADKQNKSTNM